MTPEPHADPRLRATLGTPELAWLVTRVRQRLERGRAVRGTAVLRDATSAQRAAVEALLGRAPRAGATLTVDLEELDELVRHSELADGLADAVTRLHGPVTDRAALAARSERAWAEAVTAAAARIGDRAPLQAWLADVTATGLLRRAARSDSAEGKRLLDQVLTVADRLPAAGIPLAELAASTLGDSHALDRGRPAGGLAIRAAARLGGVDLDAEGNDRRDAWAAVGVYCDELSAPVLVLGLRAEDRSLTGRVLTLHADAGEPARLSLRQLLRHPPQLTRAVTGARVFVCENPTVVASAAARLGPATAPLVCVEGQRKTAARVLLDLLNAAGIELAYHGDFDWGGLRVANVIVRDHHARPWRFTTTDYQATTGGAPLHGTPVAARWDPALAPALARTGRAVHEEQVLPDLLTDLAHRTP
ncbi:MAG: TIGR02679 family protein [Egibacteraceae bacterium]